MPKKTSSVDRDRFLISRNGWFVYQRRVPKGLVPLDSRAPMVRKALGTDDIAQARAQRDILERADDEFWASITLAASGDHAGILRQAQATASALGFTYKHSSTLLASEAGEGLLARLRALQAAPVGSLEAAAVMGTVEAPPVRISEAQRVYLEEIAADEIRGKSENQRRHWKAIKERAVDLFIEEVGDLPLSEIGRDQARKFYDFWRRRVAPATGRPTHSPNSGNRDLGTLRVLWDAYHLHIGQTDTKNPFAGLRFKDSGDRTRPPFPTKWIREKLLSRKAMAGLNPEARGIVLALIETGCRPSELCNLRPENILLEDPVPHIHIRTISDPNDPREIKTRSSTRKIPLVGVALEVFKKHPGGFPRYRDKEDSFSAATNKFMRENCLFPSDQHTLYSLRHAFEDRAKVAGLDTELRMILMGHASDRPAYGQGGSMEWRRDELQKIALPFTASAV